MDAIRVDHALIAPKPDDIGSGLIELATALQVQDDPSSETATELLSRISECKKRLETDRQFYTRPLDTHKKAIMEKYRPFIEALDHARGIVSEKLLLWQREQVRIANEKQRQALAEADWQTEVTGDIAPVVMAQAPPKTVHSASGATTIVESWDFEVTEPADVPREYLMVDDKAIRRAVLQGVRTIPGVRIFSKAGLRVTPRGG